jgi:hypothetical protein
MMKLKKNSLKKKNPSEIPLLNSLVKSKTLNILFQWIFIFIYGNAFVLICVKAITMDGKILSRQGDGSQRMP